MGLKGGKGGREGKKLSGYELFVLYAGVARYQAPAISIRLRPEMSGTNAMRDVVILYSLGIYCVVLTWASAGTRHLASRSNTSALQLAYLKNLVLSSPANSNTERH